MGTLLSTDELIRIIDERNHLRAQTAELLAALEFALPFVPMPSGRASEPVTFVEAHRAAYALLASIKEEQK